MNPQDQLQGNEASPGRLPSLAPFIAKYGATLLLLVFVVSIVPTHFVMTEHFAPYIWAFKYLGAPVFAGCIGFGLYFRSEFEAQCTKRINYWVFLVAGPLIIVMTCAGAANAANMLAPPQTPFTLTGQVTRKTHTSSRNSTTWILDVQGPYGLRRLEVSSWDYTKAQVGKPFTQERIMGPLGWSYTRK